MLGASPSSPRAQKPGDLTVQQKAQDEFQKAFCLSWNDALEQGLVYNLVDNLGLSMSELGAEYHKPKKGETVLKFCGGFYCGKVKDIIAINGFNATALWTTRSGWRFFWCGRMRRREASLRPGERVCQRCARMELCA